MAGRVLLGFCAALVAIAVAGAAEGQVASVVVGLARCADCTRKNMKAETAFKGKLVLSNQHAGICKRS
jgi:ABC-type long-subunit fatty acid transport system fused permease/ATPase subunit